TFEEKIEVERVAVNQFVDAPPPVRYEGDVMIMPLLEEVLVVEKRLVLREEVRISKHRETVNKPQQIVLRREEATVERIEPAAVQTENAPVDEQNRREN
ncbi:MAG: YsnF/AvaK domain-containing protein, partial [Acidobacteriota bacterium]|nr:YsnF/AvaK domain-containing protein [Acidobacteriota bacterium]